MFAGFALAACDARPLPRTVIPNTTFVLPLQARAYGNDTSILPGVQDRQRGDLVVVLCPPENLSCQPALSGPPPSCPEPPAVPANGYYLRTRYVTSVMPHPGSRAGIDGRLDFPAYGSDWGLVGQDLAMLDVPPQVCPGRYLLSLRTRAFNTAAGSEVPYAGGLDIRVEAAFGGLPNPSVASSLTNPFGWLDLEVGPDLAALVPNPEVALNLAGVGLSSYPAAVEIDVDYPTNRVEILTAYQGQHLGIQSLVHLRDDPIAGRVTISVIDPKRCTNQLRLVYKLRENQAPVSPLADFTVASQRLYDLNGSLITGNNPYVVGDPANGAPFCGGAS